MMMGHMSKAICTHGYNLHPRPVKPWQQFNLLQASQQSTYVEYQKPHAHIMLTQMSIQARIEKF